jgi:hypothetical protein
LPRRRAPRCGGKDPPQEAQIQNVLLKGIHPSTGRFKCGSSARTGKEKPNGEITFLGSGATRRGLGLGHCGAHRVMYLVPARDTAHPKRTLKGNPPPSRFL